MMHWATSSGKYGPCMHWHFFLMCQRQVFPPFKKDTVQQKLEERGSELTQNTRFRFSGSSVVEEKRSAAAARRSLAVS